MWNNWTGCFSIRHCERSEAIYGEIASVLAALQPAPRKDDRHEEGIVATISKTG